MVPKLDLLRSLIQDGACSAALLELDRVEEALLQVSHENQRASRLQGAFRQGGREGGQARSEAYWANPLIGEVCSEIDELLDERPDLSLSRVRQLVARRRELSESMVARWHRKKSFT